MNVVEILEEYLKKNGFNGFVESEECSCCCVFDRSVVFAELDNQNTDGLVPCVEYSCGYDISECKPAVISECDCENECAFHASFTPKEVKGEDTKESD